MVVLRALSFLGPLLFAFGFLMPLTAQTITALGWTPPFGLSPLVAGAIVAVLLGVPAQIRGRWV
mgnify:CR=1 FL=1